MHRLTAAGLACLFSLQIAAAQDPEPSPQSKAASLFSAQKFSEAADAYRAITQANAADAQAWFRLGYSLHAAGRIDEAINAHRKAAEFPRFRTHALYNLGCALALSNKPDGAFEALHRAVDAGFADASQMESDTDLASLKSDPRFAKLLDACRASVDVRRRFDFWVGDWDVFDARGNRVGQNRIELLEKGAIVSETWISARGGTGRSINFVDPEDGLWKQVWVDAAGGVVRYSGGWTDGAMRFKGTSARRDGSIETARASFTPLPDGRVRQFIEHSADGGKTWTVYFDGFYKKKAEASSKPAASGD